MLKKDLSDTHSIRVQEIEKFIKAIKQEYNNRMVENNLLRMERKAETAKYVITYILLHWFNMLLPIAKPHF